MGGDACITENKGDRDDGGRCGGRGGRLKRGGAWFDGLLGPWKAREHEISALSSVMRAGADTHVTCALLAGINACIVSP